MWMPQCCVKYISHSQPQTFQGRIKHAKFYKTNDVSTEGYSALRNSRSKYYTLALRVEFWFRHLMTLSQVQRVRNKQCKHYSRSDFSFLIAYTYSEFTHINPAFELRMNGSILYQFPYMPSWSVQGNLCLQLTHFYSHTFTISAIITVILIIQQTLGHLKCGGGEVDRITRKYEPLTETFAVQVTRNKS